MTGKKSVMIWALSEHMKTILNSEDLKKWKEHVVIKDMSEEEMLALYSDAKMLEGWSKKLAGFMKQVCVARVPEGQTSLDSDAVFMSVTWSEGRETLDKDRLLEDMGPQFVQKYMKQGEGFSTVKLERK